MTWTDERVEKLRELWGEGLTASQIARELGGVSRNAVIGKVHRLGLGTRQNTGKGEDEATEAEAPETTDASVPEVENTAPTDDVAAAEPEETAQAAPVAAALEEALDEAQQEIQTAAAAAAEVEKNARKLTLLQLNERTCKWPIGDPSTDDFYFCGLRCAPDKPYCEAHAALAYQPMSSRRDRERSRSRNRAVSA